MCIKLIHYKDYTEIHGQEKIQISDQMLYLFSKFVWYLAYYDEDDENNINNNNNNNNNNYYFYYYCYWY